MQKFLLLLFPLIVVGCASKQADPPIPAGEKGNIAMRGADDPSVAKAAAEAQRRLPEFKKRLASAKPGEEFFIKVPMPTPDDSREHIWFEQVTYANGKFHCKLANDPIYLKMKIGDAADIAEADVEDWIIQSEKGKEGGFSIDAVQPKP